MRMRPEVCYEGSTGLDLSNADQTYMTKKKLQAVYEALGGHRVI